MNLPDRPPETFKTRAVVAWLLYDFANSAFVAVIPATVYSKYYALAVVGNDRGQGDFRILGE